MKHDPPDVRKAHDIRHLCICKGCGELGDDRKLLQIDGTNYHGDCAFKLLGSRILDLPRTERGKFTLADIGSEMMRRLLASSHAE